MNSLKKILLKRIEIQDKKGDKVFIFKKYYRYFKDFKGKSDFKFDLNYKRSPFFLLLYFDFYIREKIFPKINDFLIFHASSISNGKEAFLIGGRTKVGKSLLAFLISKNLFYLSDDISPLIIKNKFFSFPYPQPIKLHRDFKKYLDDEETIEDENFEEFFVFPKKIIKDNFFPLKCFIFPIPSKINKITLMDKKKAFLYLSAICINRKEYIKNKGLRDLVRIVEEVPFYKIFWKDIEFLYQNGLEITQRF